jgi:hypothetical protein
MFSDRKPEVNAFGDIFRLTHKEPGSAAGLFAVFGLPLLFLQPAGLVGRRALAYGGGLQN